ncbi:hypothetical protein J6590_051483 [Homalodisca vitripennis]|nr:hypothetical protein J6590_051483 [Homalodisca vitripennis]
MCSSKVISIFTDSQAALKALNSCVFNSKPFRDCYQVVILLAESTMRPIANQLKLKGLLRTPEVYLELNQFTVSAVQTISVNNRSGLPGEFTIVFESTKDEVILLCRSVNEQGNATVGPFFSFSDPDATSILSRIQRKLTSRQPQRNLALNTSGRLGSRYFRR